MRPWVAASVIGLLSLGLVLSTAVAVDRGRQLTAQAEQLTALEARVELLEAELAAAEQRSASIGDLAGEVLGGLLGERLSGTLGELLDGFLDDGVGGLLDELLDRGFPLDRPDPDATGAVPAAAGVTSAYSSTRSSRWMTSRA